MQKFTLSKVVGSDTTRNLISLEKSEKRDAQDKCKLVLSYRSAIAIAIAFLPGKAQINYARLSRDRSHRGHRIQDPQQGPNRGRPDCAMAIDAPGVHRDRRGNVRGFRCT